MGIAGRAVRSSDPIRTRHEQRKASPLPAPETSFGGDARSDLPDRLRGVVSPRFARNPSIAGILPRYISLTFKFGHHSRLIDSDKGLQPLTVVWPWNPRSVRSALPILVLAGPLGALPLGGATPRGVASRRRRLDVQPEHMRDGCSETWVTHSDVALASRGGSVRWRPPIGIGLGIGVARSEPHEMQEPTRQAPRSSSGASASRRHSARQAWAVRRAAQRRGGAGPGAPPKRICAWPNPRTAANLATAISRPANAPRPRDGPQRRSDRPHGSGAGSGARNG
jgi:hypothetical protein